MNILYGGTKTEMERLLADAQKLTGVEYNIDNLGDVYDAIHVIQEDLGLTGVAAQEASETFSGSFAAMKASATNLLANLSLGKDITAPLNDLRQSLHTFIFGNLLPMLGNVVKALPEVIYQAIDEFSSLLSTFAANSGTFITTGISIIGGIVQSIAGALPGLAAAALNIITGLVQYLLSGDWLSALQEVAINIFTEFTDAINGAFTGEGNAFDGIVEAFTSIDWAGAAETVLGFLSDAMALGVEVIPQVLQTIGLTAINFFQSIDWVGLGQTVINFIVGGIQILAANIPTYMQNIGKTAMTLFRAIDWIALGKTVITLIKSGITALFTAIPTLLKSIGQGALNLFKSINWREVGRTVINLIKMGIRALATAIPQALKTIGTNAMNGFKSINWASVGWAVVNGIKSGISALAGSLVSAVTSLGSRALAGIKSILHIGSPSKVFADQVGAMMAEGIRVGWEKNLPTDEMIADTKAMADELSSASTVPGSSYTVNSTEGKLDAILSILAQYIPEIADRDVVLDSGKMVGALSPALNRELGKVMGW